jgi:NAD dependent epimerase/dehydratase
LDWENKKVLVTGADGFIGSHLTEYLLSKNCKVRALSYYNSFNYWGWLEDMGKHDRLEIVTGDVRDAQLCREIAQGVDVVFHLAALIAIPYSYRAPQSYVDTNVKGTLNICQAAKENGCRLIHTSTSEVYGTAQYVPIDEKHPLQPQSPYSATKIAADSMAMSFYNAYDLQVTIGRPFNTYGPRQSLRAVIPTIITQLLKGEKRIKLGDLAPTRDFNFVKDTCRGLVSLAEHDATIGEIVNIGSNFEASIGQTFELIKELLSVKAEVVQEKERIRPEKSEVNRLWCNNDKIRSLTGFVPEYNFEQGLKETIEWYRRPENLAKFKTDVYNV